MVWYPFNIPLYFVPQFRFKIGITATVNVKRMEHDLPTFPTLCITPLEQIDLDSLTQVLSTGAPSQSLRICRQHPGLWTEFLLKRLYRPETVRRWELYGMEC
jgi:hypothetical protein